MSPAKSEEEESDYTEVKSTQHAHDHGTLFQFNSVHTKRNSV